MQRKRYDPEIKARKENIQYSRFQISILKKTSLALRLIWILVVENCFGIGS